MQAVYEPTDLAALTAELASNFRSACEKAGLRLVVDCPPLPEPVYVDRDMWEKVVLNLVSNAFKFTLEGEIAVLLTRRRRGGADRPRHRDRHPGRDLPRIFERFHRVEGSPVGRTRGRASAWHWSRSSLSSTAARSGRRAPYGRVAPSRDDPVRDGPPAGRPDRGGPAGSSFDRGGGGRLCQEALCWLPDRRRPAFPSTEGNAREAFPLDASASRPAGSPRSRSGASRRPRSSGPTTTRTCASTSADCWAGVTTWKPSRTGRRPGGRPATAAGPGALRRDDAAARRLRPSEGAAGRSHDPTIPVILLSAGRRGVARGGPRGRCRRLPGQAVQRPRGAGSRRRPPGDESPAPGGVPPRASVWTTPGRPRSASRPCCEASATGSSPSTATGITRRSTMGLREHGDEPGRGPGPVHLGPLPRYHRDALRGRTAPRHIIEQKPSVFEYFYPSRARWYENRLYPSADGLSIFFTEVTERRRTKSG